MWMFVWGLAMKPVPGTGVVFDPPRLENRAEAECKLGYKLQYKQSVQYCAKAI